MNEGGRLLRHEDRSRKVTRRGGVFKDQMPAATSYQRRYTARHLLPCRGSCREKFRFHYRCNGEPTKVRKQSRFLTPRPAVLRGASSAPEEEAVCHMTTTGRWRPTAMSQATRPSITVKRTRKGAPSRHKTGPVGAQRFSVFMPGSTVQ